jgi:hypothetical protein
MVDSRPSQEVSHTPKRPDRLWGPTRLLSKWYSGTLSSEVELPVPWLRAHNRKSYSLCRVQLRNVVFSMKDRTMDNAQNCDSYVNIPSSEACRSWELRRKSVVTAEDCSSCMSVVLRAFHPAVSLSLLMAKCLGKQSGLRSRKVLNSCSKIAGFESRGWDTDYKQIFGGSLQTVQAIL